MLPRWLGVRVRRNALWVIVVIGAALIQSTLLDAIKIQGVQPDLIVLMVVYFALTEGEERAMFTGALGGVYQDVAGDAVLGHHILCNVIVGYATGKLATRLIVEHPAVKAGLVFCAGLVHGLTFTAIQYMQNPGMSAIYTVATSAIPGAFYTALCTPVVFLLLAWMFHRERQGIQEELFKPGKQ